MKIQLINAPLLEKGSGGEYQTNLFQPLGIMYLAAYLRKYFPKVEIKLTDGTLLGIKKTIDTVLKYNPDIVGISSFTANSTGGYSLVNQIKKQKPDTFIIFGGVHASALPEDVFKRSKTDLVVIGEGEETLKEIVSILLQNKRNFSKIDGVAYRTGSRIKRTKTRSFIQNLDDLPFPAYDLLEFRENYSGWYFRKQSPETTIMSTRGCPFHCFFCVDVIWKSSRPFFRPRSPKNIVDELEYLQKNYGIKEFFDVCDEFNASESWAIAVCKEIKKRKLKMTWKCQMRADKVSQELARNMSEAGCWFVSLGVESGNQRTIEGIGKKINLSQVEDSCRNLKKYGIKVSLFMMVFNIWSEKNKLVYENVDDSLNSLKYARNLVEKGLADFFSWGPTTPYPGSPLYKLALKKKLISKKLIGHWEKWNNIWGVPVNLPGISRYDYVQVKILGVFWQTLHIMKNMNRVLNIGTLTQLPGRILGFISLSSFLIKKNLLGKE